MEDENSWFTNTPTLEHSKRPAVFGLKDVTPVSRRAFDRTGDAGIYTRPVVRTLGHYSSHGCFEESLTKILSRTHRLQHSNLWTRILFLLCSTNGLLCGQHDFPQVLQKSIYGHFWFKYLHFGILWNLFLLLSVHQSYRQSHSYGLKTFGNSPSYWRVTWVWQGIPERFLQINFNFFSNVSF